MVKERKDRHFRRLPIPQVNQEKKRCPDQRDGEASTEVSGRVRDEADEPRAAMGRTTYRSTMLIAANLGMNTLQTLFAQASNIGSSENGG